MSDPSNSRPFDLSEAPMGTVTDTSSHEPEWVKIARLHEKIFIDSILDECQRDSIRKLAEALESRAVACTALLRDFREAQSRLDLEQRKLRDISLQLGLKEDTNLFSITSRFIFARAVLMKLDLFLQERVAGKRIIETGVSEYLSTLCAQMQDALSKDRTQDSHQIPGSFDAQDWAREFIRIAADNPSIATDEGTMTSWFANALMTGFDHAHRHPESEPPATAV